MDYKSRFENLVEWGIEHEKKLLVGLALTLGFLIGLGSGLLTSSNQVSPIIIDKNIKVGLPAQSGLPVASGDSSASKKSVSFGNFSASINGKAYYPANCEAAKRIKEENRIWFTSAKEAEDQGYAPAKNCP